MSSSARNQVGPMVAEPLTMGAYMPVITDADRLIWLVRGMSAGEFTRQFRNGLPAPELLRLIAALPSHRIDELQERTPGRRASGQTGADAGRGPATRSGDPRGTRTGRNGSSRACRGVGGSPVVGQPLGAWPSTDRATAGRLAARAAGSGRCPQSWDHTLSRQPAEETRSVNEYRAGVAKGVAGAGEPPPPRPWPTPTGASADKRTIPQSPRATSDALSRGTPTRPEWSGRGRPGRRSCCPAGAGTGGGLSPRSCRTAPRRLPRCCRHE